jgi:hypothetical protein
MELDFSHASTSTPRFTLEGINTGITKTVGTGLMLGMPVTGSTSEFSRQ